MTITEMREKRNKLVGAMDAFLDRQLQGGERQ